VSEHIRRATPPTGASDPNGQLVACAMSTLLPGLAEFLWADEWEPGCPRERGTVLICFQDGRWRVWLNDRDSGLSSWVSGPTLESVLLCADEGVRDGTLEWRRSGKQTSPRAKK
jgi:hypothetical protein